MLFDMKRNHEKVSGLIFRQRNVKKAFKNIEMNQKNNNHNAYMNLLSANLAAFIWLEFIQSLKNP